MTFRKSYIILAMCWIATLILGIYGTLTLEQHYTKATQAHVQVFVMFFVCLVCAFIPFTTRKH